MARVNLQPFTIYDSLIMETPKDKLKKMIAWDAAPTLTDTEVDDLLAGASVMDKNGVAPSAVGWNATYDLNSAAATGWLIKATRAAALTEVDPPGSGIVTSKVFDNCRAMARIYSRKRTTTLNINALN